MRNLPDIRSCKTKPEMLQMLAEVETAIVELCREVPDDLIATQPEPEGWSVEKNMKHISTLFRTVSLWTNMPPWLIRLRGRPKPNLRIEEISATNRGKMRNYGKYPIPGKPRPEVKDELVAHFAVSLKKFRAAIENRNESDLDALAGPFGGMTLRTFLLFTMKHATHHMGVVKTRLEA